MTGGSLPPRPWTTGARRDPSFPSDLLEGPVLDAARGLLGAVLVSTVGGERTAGVIVETEAYAGAIDPASHASAARGMTRRNRAMFGPPGRAYVYRSYGMHWCMNVVTGPAGQAQAVLLRGIEPLEGEDVMERRRGGARPLGAGPGRLCEALGITDALYGHDLREPPLVLEAGWSVPDACVGNSPRVGIREAADWPYRFYVRGSPGVSRPDGWGALQDPARRSGVRRAR
ncbi:MAG TPA: DNA-3-methyladenine glycosylase [Longimicrobiales bacterium]|nr:DNA-3-methyladenine glycosylase [Longimicrobiales bacterium]